MKKWLIAVLLVVACVFGLTACGSSAGSEAPAELELTEDQRQQWYDSASQFVLAMNDAVQNGTAQEQMDDPVYGPALSGWENALRDIGEVQDIVGKSCSFTKKEGTVTVTVKGSRHDADVVFMMESGDQGYSPTSITTNVEYDMNEKIQQAGMNTVLGMGTTFAILILLAFVITAFGAVMSSAARKATKEAPKKEAEKIEAPAPEAVSAEKESAGGQPDDAELIAVIAAAVAAAEGQPANDLELTAILSAAVAAYEEDSEEKIVHPADEFIARTIKKSRRR